MTYLADDLDDVSEEEENKKDVEKDLADLHFTLSNNATKDVKGYHAIHNNNNNNSNNNNSNSINDNNNNNNDNVTNEAHHSTSAFPPLSLSFSQSLCLSLSVTPPSLSLYLSPFSQFISFSV